MRQVDDTTGTDQRPACAIPHPSLWQRARVSDRVNDPALRGALIWIHGPVIDDSQRAATNLSTGDPPALLAVHLALVTLLHEYAEDVAIWDLDSWKAGRGA